MLSSVFSTVAFAAEHNILDGFLPEASDIYAQFEKEYSWDRNKYLDKTVTFDISGTDVEIPRNYFEKEFLDNNIETTKKYLKETGDGTGGSSLSKTIDYTAEFIQTVLGEVGTAEVGSTNIVKYNEWLYGADFAGPWPEWSGTFVAWCADQVGAIEDGTFVKTGDLQEQFNHLTSEKGFNKYNFTQTSLAGGSSYEAVPGDLLFWKDKNGNFTHVGIIVSASGTSFTIVEGDKDDAVRQCDYNYLTQEQCDAEGLDSEAYEDAGKMAFKIYEKVPIYDDETHHITGYKKGEQLYQGGLEMDMVRGVVVHVQYQRTVAGVGSLGTEENARYIYHFLKERGVPDPMIAGCLGNWSHESGIDTTRLEDDYGLLKGEYRHTMTPEKLEVMDNPGPYMARLQTAYKNTIIKKRGRTTTLYACTNWSAYVGRDGKMYPGIGLGGFTGPAATDLMDLAKALGANWWDLNVQLEYCFTNDIPCRDGKKHKGFRTDFFTSEANKNRYARYSAAQAAYYFLHEWEGIGYEAFGQCDVPDRQKWANHYYNNMFPQWANETYSLTGSGSGGSPDANQENQT